MLRTVSPQPTLWESVIPECLMGLLGDLGEIDVLLDDPVFFEPFRTFFHPVMGRPSIPMETYLRMMFLKYRYRLGFEPLCAEVVDSLAWRRFCRVPLGTSAPHPTTLMKTSRCGERRWPGSTRRCWPRRRGPRSSASTSSGPTPRWWRPTFPIPPTRGCWPRAWPSWAPSAPRPRTAAWPPAQQSGTAPDRCTAGPMPSPPGCAGATTTPRPRSRPSPPRWQASPRWRWSRPATWPPMPGGACAVAVTAPRPRQRRWWPSSNAASRWWRQSRPRPEFDSAATCPTALPGSCPCTTPTPGPSPRDDWASRWSSATRPRWWTTPMGSSSTTTWSRATPDAPMLVPAMARIEARFGKAPRAVTADRGYGEAGVDAGLEAMGVKKVVIPRKGKPGAARREVQGRRGFRNLVKWRTGSEARISSLKRDHGWRRSLVDGIGGAQTWCAWGVLANNATKISALITAQPTPTTTGPGRAPDAPARPGTGPPGRRRAAPAA